MNVFTLYRFFDSNDVLLYVGLTVNPGRRMEKHRGTKEWWSDVARIAMEQHSDIEALRAAERAAIKDEKPLHNIRMNGGSPKAAKAAGDSDAMRLCVAEDDSLVGRFFHTWTTAGEDDYDYRPGERRPICQGQIKARIDDLYLAGFFSWFDGCATNGEQLVNPYEGDWTFYDTAEAMIVALGCRESIGRGTDRRRCGNSVSHRVHLEGIGYAYACWRCIDKYSGKAEEL